MTAFLTIFCHSKIHTQTVSLKKLCLTLLYEKDAHKMLMKLTPGPQPTFSVKKISFPENFLQGS